MRSRRSTAFSTRRIRKIVSRDNRPGPVTIAATNQAAPPSPGDPVARGLRNGAFFQSGGRQMLFNLEPGAGLREVARGIGWTGRIAYHQWRGPGVPVILSRGAPPMPVLYPGAKEAFLSGGIDFVTNVVAAVLVDTGTYTYAQVDRYAVRDLNAYRTFP